MAKGKKSSGKHYVSKGLFPSYSRKNRNDYRRWKRENDFFESMMARERHRWNIMSQTKNKSLKKLRERYLREEEVFNQASELYHRYKDKGAKWSACVQAVKTDWVDRFKEKMSKRTNG